MSTMQQSHYRGYIMGKPIRQNYTTHPGDQLKNLVNLASFGGLFFSALGTGLVWTGSESLHCPSAIWEMSLLFNLIFFGLPWMLYLPFRHTDRLLGNGLLATLVLIDLFWVFGFAMFYFYFIFSPINLWLRVAVLVAVTAILIYRAYLISNDIKEALRKNENLFDRMYLDEGNSFSFKRDAIGLLEEARKDRNPFKTFHSYAAMIVAPFVLVLNRLLTPFVGDGHGVFLVMAFFSIPIMLWGIGILVQTVITMIYFPIKLQRETGKPVLMKDW